MGQRDMLIVRPPVKSSLVLRISVVAFVMVCGVFMCLIGLKQISSFTKAGFVDIRVVERPCDAPNVESWERPYVHFPKPTTFSRAECSCNPVRYFVIASTQRSGSGWFETLLNSHMNVSSNGEIFSVKPRRSNMSTIEDTLDKIYNLDWLTSASKYECTTAGLMQNHEAIFDYFNTKGVLMIFLFRRNLLRRRISILANAYDQSAKPLNGKHKSHVHSPDEAKILASYKPSINTTLLIPELHPKSTNQGEIPNHLYMFIQQALDLEKQLQTSKKPDDLRSKLEDVNLVIADNTEYYILCRFLPSDWK
ncbi:P-loop containing nucleoside triphosphate hydrolase superfamily protein [Tanacetum coccineum]